MIGVFQLRINNVHPWKGEMARAVCFAPTKPVHDSTEKHFMDVLEDVVKSVRWIPLEHVQVGTQEHIVDDAGPLPEEIVKVLADHRRLHGRADRRHARFTVSGTTLWR